MTRSKLKEVVEKGVVSVFCLFVFCFIESIFVHDAYGDHLLCLFGFALSFRESPLGAFHPLRNQMK